MNASCIGLIVAAMVLAPAAGPLRAQQGAAPEAAAPERVAAPPAQSQPAGPPAQSQPAVPPPAAPIEFHVAPNGNDRNPGTAVRPFNSLIVARDAIRDLKRAGGLPPRGVRVVVHGGLYLLAETVLFEAEDSGTEQGPIVYEAAVGESPLLSGGQEVRGWGRLAQDPPGVAPAARGRLWAADVPKGWLFHSLYVNGEPCRRARRPDSDSPADWPRLVAVGVPHRLGQTLYFPSDSLLNLGGDIEVCVCAGGQAGNTLSTLGTIDRARSSARRQSRQVLPPAQTGDAFRIENALAALDRPGEWCLNTVEGRVYYWPPGGSMEGARVLAPALYNLVRFQGDEEDAAAAPAPAAAVRFIRLRGLTFLHTDRMGENLWPEEWLKAAVGHPDAVVVFQGAEDCRLESCRIFYSGTYGVALDRRARRIGVVDNEMALLGSGGVRLTGDGPGAADANRDNVVSRNHIHHLGLGPYGQAPGIVLYGSGHNQVTHNFIHDAPGPGIAVLGTPVEDINSRDRTSRLCDAFGNFDGRYNILWDKLPAGSKDRWARKQGTFTRDSLRPLLNSGENLVAFNVLTDVMRTPQEGAALYGRCCGGGNVWRRNAIRFAAAEGGQTPEGTASSPRAIVIAEEADPATVEGNVAWGSESAVNKCGAEWTDNTLSTQRTAAYDALMRTIADEVDRQGGWPGQRRLPQGRPTTRPATGAATTGPAPTTRPEGWIVE